MNVCILQRRYAQVVNKLSCLHKIQTHSIHDLNGDDLRSLEASYNSLFEKILYEINTQSSKEHDDGLKKTIADLRAKIETEHEHDVELAKQIDALETDYSALSSRANDVKADDSMLQEMYKLQEQYAALISSVTTDEATHATKTDLEAVQTTISTLNTRVDREHQHDLQLKQQIQDINDSITTLTNQARISLTTLSNTEVLDNQIQEYTKMSAKLDESVVEIKQQVGFVESSRDTVKHYNSHVHNNHTRVNGQIITINATQKELESQEKDLARKYENYNTLITELQANYVVQFDEFSQLNSDYVKQEELQLITQKLPYLEEQANAIEASYTESGTEYDIDALGDQVDKNTSNIKVLQDNVYFIVKEVRRLHSLDGGEDESPHGSDEDEDPLEDFDPSGPIHFPNNSISRDDATPDKRPRLE